MIRSTILFLVLCSSCLSLCGNEYIKNPPKGWECIDDPTQLPNKVKVIYIGKESSNQRFTSSMNVSSEQTPLPLHEYLALAKSYHEGQGDTHCTLLGKVKTAAGAAELLQIDRTSQLGEVRFIQAMLIHQEHAYVITATCLKSDFSSLSSQIFKAIQSFTLSET